MIVNRDLSPRIAKKARLRRDRVTGKHVLLYPERGLELNQVGTRVVELCDGARSVAAIAETIASETSAPILDVERDVLAFLARLAERGLVEGS